MVVENLVKLIINKGDGVIQPLFINEYETTKGTGLCNPSLLYHQGKLLMNLRHVEYTLFMCHKFQSMNQGPVSYYHRDDDCTLRTNNYLCELDPSSLEIMSYEKIDTSKLNVKPIWTFIGLEDGRLINWNDTLYLCGVRRDTNTEGKGRMEFSEIVDGKEVSRHRIEPPNANSYCEKNWMPILDKPFHFVKWTNPVEVVKVDIDTLSSKQVHLHNHLPNVSKYDLRGGTPLIRWDKDTYISVVHECHFTLKNHLGFKDSIYRHRFILWDSTDFTVKLISEDFNFMTAEIEFCIGMEVIDDEVIIAFSYQDNCSYAIKTSKEFINDFIWTQSKPSYLHS